MLAIILVVLAAPVDDARLALSANLCVANTVRIAALEKLASGPAPAALLKDARIAREAKRLQFKYREALKARGLEPLNCASSTVERAIGCYFAPEKCSSGEGTAARALLDKYEIPAQVSL